MTCAKRFMQSTFVVMLTLAAVSTARAQSFIYSQPSATVTDNGSGYCEGDANPAITPQGSGAYMGRCMFGLFKGLELGVNGLGVSSNPPSSAEIQPTLKYQWFNKDNFQIATGVTGFMPLTHTDTEHGFAMLYTVGRYQTKVSDLGGYSPAFSAGVWGLLGANPGTGSKGGAILGVEQPFVLSKSGSPVASFVMDYQSGNQTHAGFSAKTPGIVVNLPHNFVVAAGYSFSNLGRQYDTPAFWVGYTFKLHR